ncbi:hypothetical protein [Nocardioides zhouii]|uniref:Uncharacterized protein n=1 Tax=Nocardioides zhouii TaxID=1168729 RepID=A0A4Q2SN95_9ACTN|nr:hypothetical protein [Nocardioides zhouii]RYC07072.1 hypothetical protein EUA94_16300 [Nocardioides zhouii]
MGKRQAGITAGELIAELEADPEHQARRREREAAADEEHAVLREVEKPVVADLAAIGVEVDSPWNLYRDPDARARAVPVLLDHLDRDYPDMLSHVLSHVAVREHYDDLLSFLSDESLGSTRISFIRPVNRIGNRIEQGKGRQVIEGLVDHPQLSAEARAVLAGRSRNS